MEVAIPTALDFEFGSSVMSSPYSTMPSTPTRLGGGGYFFSAPTSPSRISNFYRNFDEAYGPPSPPAVPYKWESNPGTPKSPGTTADEEADFAFEFSEALEQASLSADELFDGGKIRPLKPPPRLQAVERERGRERGNPSLSASRRRATRSLSPLRVSKYHWEGDETVERVNAEKVNVDRSQNNKQNILAIFSKPSFWSSPSSSSSSSKKWRLRDFLLFRSASEGRATDKKYKSTTGSFGSGQRRKAGPAVSAHALHYTVNKAVSEDMKKKTFLPYKQGILGRLAFNPAVSALANGFGSFARS